jgi:hypothetical protein
MLNIRVAPCTFRIVPNGVCSPKFGVHWCIRLKLRQFLMINQIRKQHVLLTFIPIRPVDKAEIDYDIDYFNFAQFWPVSTILTTNEFWVLNHC